MSIDILAQVLEPFAILTDQVQRHDCKLADVPHFVALTKQRLQRPVRPEGCEQLLFSPLRCCLISFQLQARG